MACTINASTTNGIVQTADGSGLLKIQSNSVTTNALAWVNFNGTGTVAIRSSYNVSSITDNGTGDYTVNFATALADANYVTIMMSRGAQDFYQSDSAQTTTTVRLRINDAGGSAYDSALTAVAVFGN